jgi:hypothetical protein
MTTTKKFSELPAGVTLGGGETVAVVQSGSSVRTTASNIANTATQLTAFSTGTFAGAASLYSFDKPISPTGITSTVQLITAAGAVNLTTLTTEIQTSGVTALTLANGTAGQLKFIVMTVDGGDATLTPTNLVGASSTITFNDIGDSVLLIFLASDWHIVSNNGCTVA